MREYRKQYYKTHPEAYEAQKRRARIWQYEHRRLLREQRKAERKKAVEAASQPSDKAQCPQCNAQRYPGGVFCSECGFRFAA
jgi:hypothetical protein